MIAPVTGSGAWPAWIAPARKCQPVSLRTSSLSLHTSPQVVNEVDLCDQTEEFTGFHDNGDAVRPEDWYERVERLVRFDNLLTGSS